MSGYGSYGDILSWDKCGTCDGLSLSDEPYCGQLPNETCCDCNGDAFGTAAEDSCGICYGGNTNIASAGSTLDECGVCGGDNTSCDEGCGANKPAPVYYYLDVDGDGTGSGAGQLYCV